MTSLEQWKHSVVNVELGNCVNDTENRQSGTAIFVTYQNRFFLITAAHLLIDKKIGSEKPLFDQLYNVLLRVPLLDELKDEQKMKVITKSLFYDENGNLYSEYISDPAQRKGEEIPAPNSIELTELTDPEFCAVSIAKDIDLAVISLRIRVREFLLRILSVPVPIFVEELLQLGYHPISINEIQDEPSQEGADIFTVGYPAHVSQIDKRDEIINKFEKDFSTDISLPCFTFGKVSLLSQHIPYFWGDLRIYSGNSGCPVIEDEKLVGIVTHDAVIDETIGVNHVPFAKATKARFIRKLLDEQMSKDDAFVGLKNLHVHFPDCFKSPEEIQKEREEAIKHKPTNSKILFHPQMKDYLAIQKISDGKIIIKRDII